MASIYTLLLSPTPYPHLRGNLEVSHRIQRAMKGLSGLQPLNVLFVLTAFLRSSFTWR